MNDQVLSDFLMALLRRHQLPVPDQRPLFDYQLGVGDYLDLQQRLQANIASQGSMARWAERSLSWPVRQAPAAAFVLYATEWWRREYAGGAWSWPKIMQSLDPDADALPPQMRSRFVLLGLSFWGLSTHDEGRRYLGPIVSNSGIPLRLLATGAGAVANLLAQVLRQADRFAWGPAQVLVAVKERQGMLPSAYQNTPMVADLLAALVEAALILRREFNLQGMTDPVAVLDRQEPDWRRRFPISLEGESAKTLLTGLIKEAASPAQPQVQGLFVAERRLVRQGDAGVFALETHLSHPQRVPADELAVLFGLLDTEKMPRYFHIDLEAGQRQPWVEGRLKLGTAEPTATLTGRRTVLHDSAARAELQLVLRSQAGDEGAHCTVRGGNELTEDEPWIFVEDELGRPVLACMGAARLPQAQAWVAMASGWGVEDCAQPPEEAGQLPGPGPDHRKVLRLRCDATLVCEGLRYRLRLNQTTQAGQMYQWTGSRLPEAQGRAVFRGQQPKLCRVTETGLQPLQAAQQQWRRPGTQQILSASNARGPVEVRVVDGDEVLTRQRFFVLPPEARIQYTSGQGIGTAQVQLLGWGPIEVSAEAPTGGRAQVQREGEQGWRIDLSAEGPPPSDFRVHVRWPGCPSELRLWLPYPVNGGRFLRSDGSVMRASETLTLRDLMGMRLQIFENHPDRPRKYELQLSLGQGLREISSPYPIQLPAGSERAEVRLMDFRPQIEGLLGLYDDLDAKVQVSLLAGGQAQCALQVGRYAAVLQREEDCVRVPEAALALLGVAALENTPLQASSLTHPDATPVALTPLRSEGVHTGVWEVPSLAADHGPWLVQPVPEASVLFRPLLWLTSAETNEAVAPAPVDETDDNPPELALAMTEANATLRGQHIHAALQAMSTQHQHASWALMDYLWRAFRHLPLSALDVWRMLAKQPEALMSFVLRTELPTADLIEALRRLQRETAWVPELTNVADLSAAAQAHQAYWQVLGLAANQAQRYFEGELQSRLTVLKNEFPSLSPLIESVVFAMTGVLGSEIKEAANIPTQKLIDQIWLGTDSLLNTQLFQVNHDKDYKLFSNFVERQSLPAFLEKCPIDRGEKLRPLLTKIIWNLASWHPYFAQNFNNSQRPDVKFTVVNMPILCALWAATSCNRQFWSNPGHRLALKRIRDFDPIWFEQAYRQALKVCLSIDGLVHLPQSAAL